MDFCIICNEGFEDLVSKELKNICNISSKIERGIVLFKGNLEDVVKFCYKTQSAKKVLKLISKFIIEDDTALFNEISKIDFSFIDGSFLVRSNKHSLEKEIGALIYKKIKNPNVSLKNPDYVIYVNYLNNNEKTEISLGIDLCAIDLSKRSYKIFTHPSSIKGTLAYFLVALSGYKGKGLFLDPCSGAGTISTEAGFIASKISPRYFDKSDIFYLNQFKDVNLKELLSKIDDEIISKEDSKLIDIRNYDVDLQAVNAVKKNLKIAGIEKYIFSAKGDIDWLETKFDENSVDFIVSNPPSYTSTNQKKNDKFYERFFYQTEFVLSKKGKIILLLNSKRPIEFATKYKLKSNLERQFQLGDKEMYVFSFKK